MTGSVPGTGNHGLESKRDISTKKLHNDVTNALRDRYKIYMFAQRRDQILPGIVTGLKEEITFEICFLK